MRSCRLFGISRQSVYQQAHRDKEKSLRHEPVKAMVDRLCRIMPRIGTRKLYCLIKPDLNERGIKMGHHGLFAYLCSYGLLVKSLKSYTKTTFNHHRFKKHPNLLANLVITRPEEVFASDITYVKSEEGIHYFSLVTDARTRKIVGHHLSLDMAAESVVKALRVAVKKRHGSNKLIYHSDRGSQYCSDVYHRKVKKKGILPSITDGYDCYQNALAERVNGILKQEFLLFL